LLVVKKLVDTIKEQSEAKRDSDLEFYKKKLELHKKRLENLSFWLDIILRYCFFWLACGLVAYWIYNVVDILNTSGAKDNNFELSRGVLIALLTTTTANIIGIATIIARYLFPNRGG